MDVPKILGIVGTLLILALILKDATKFNTAVGAVNSTISTLGSLG